MSSNDADKIIRLSVCNNTFLINIQIEYKDLASTLEKLKAQHPSLYIPNSQSDELGSDNSGLPDDVKPLSDMANATPMDISRLVTHLSKVVAASREEVSAILHELQVSVTTSTPPRAISMLIGLPMWLRW